MRETQRCSSIGLKPPLLSRDEGANGEDADQLQQTGTGRCRRLGDQQQDCRRLEPTALPVRSACGVKPKCRDQRDVDQRCKTDCVASGCHTPGPHPAQ